jgi:hypothetical protein
MVFAFDIQEAAMAATRELLQRENVPAETWELFQAGHETMLDAIPARWHGKAGAVVFNLGYLPGGEKTFITTESTTIPAMRASLTMLRPGGLLVAVIYTGHPGGSEEAAAVLEFARNLAPREYHVFEYRTLNARNHSPFVLAIEKAADGKSC